MIEKTIMSSTDPNTFKSGVAIQEIKTLTL
ncbi:hypothetical protein DZA65_01817 [Dickeya dianthicola]|nr:hypothetical protein DZA65_01817 [Dickeya dianthicola]